MKLTKVAVLAALAATVTGAAFATPQTQFNQGQFQLDAGAWWPKAETSAKVTGFDSRDVDFSSKANFTGGLTYGITDRLALQYEYDGLKTDNTHFGGGVTGKTDGDMHQANLIYSLNKNFAVYGGWARIANKVKGSSALGSDTVVDQTNNIAQAGLIAKVPIGNVVEVFGKAGIGTKKTTTWEAGLGFKVTPDLDITGGYRYVNTKLYDKGDTYDGLRASDDENITYKGFFTNLSYRFGGHSEKAEPVAVEEPVYTPAPVVEQPAPQKLDYYVDSIHFATGSATPLASQGANLNHMVQTAQQYPNDTIKLVGNTDNTGNPQLNMNLSKDRVQNVYNYAINHGVPASQLEAEYRGQNDPASTNATVQGRADNRRVDVWVNR